MTETEIFTLPEDMLRLKDAGYDISKSVFAWMIADRPKERLEIFYNNRYNRDRWADVMMPTFSFQELNALLPESFGLVEEEKQDPENSLEYYPSFGPGTKVRFLGQSGEFTLEEFEEESINKSMVSALVWLSRKDINVYK